MITKQVTGQIEKAQTAGFDGTFALSTEDIDADGDVILAKGWDLSRFNKNPIALWQHDHRQPIGTWENVRVEGKRLLGDLKLATTNLAQMAKTLIDDGVLKAVSVGFRPIDYDYRDEDAPHKGFLIKTAELLETSLVSVPANPQALLLSKQLGLSNEERTLVFDSLEEGKSADPDLLEKAKALYGKSAEPETHKPEIKTMKLSDRIQAKQEELTALRGELAVATELYADDVSDENEETVKGFAEKIEAAEKQLATFEVAEKNIMASVKAPTEIEGAPAVVRSVKNPDAAELVFRQASVKLISHITKRSQDEVIKERYPHDKELLALTKATDATPAQVGVDEWAGYLLGQQTAAFVDLIANNSVYGALRGRGLSLDFAGSKSIAIPYRGATPNLSGNFVGEGLPIRVAQAVFSQKVLVPHKMAVISTMTEEIYNSTNGQIESIVRQAILDDTSKSLDSILLDTTAADTVRPAGLLEGVTPTVSAGDTAENIITDIKALLATFLTDDAAKNVVILINPQRVLGLATAVNTVGDMMFAAQVSSGSIMGIPLVQSSNVAADEVIAVNAGEFATAYDGPRFTVSNTATLHMEQDQADVDPISTAGTPNVVAAPVRSLFQTDSIGIRTIFPVTWDMRRADNVSALSSVSW